MHSPLRPGREDGAGPGGLGSPWRRAEGARPASGSLRRRCSAGRVEPGHRAQSDDDVQRHALRGARNGRARQWWDRAGSRSARHHGIMVTRWIQTGSSMPEELISGAHTPRGSPGRPDEVAEVIAFRDVNRPPAWDRSEHVRPARSARRILGRTPADLRLKANLRGARGRSPAGVATMDARPG